MAEAPRLRILLIENSVSDAAHLRALLSDHNAMSCDVTILPTLATALDRLTDTLSDIVFLNLTLPDSAGLEAVARLRSVAPTVPLIVMVPGTAEPLALEALKHGADDYLRTNAIDSRALARTLRHTLHATAMARALGAERERSTTLDSIGDAVISADSTGAINFVNAAAERLSGWSAGAAIGEPLGSVIRIVDAKSRVPFADPMPALSEGTPLIQLRGDYNLVRHDGIDVAVEGSVAPMRDEYGTWTGAVMVIRDVSADRATAQQLAHHAQHDFLTGLPNRILLSDRIKSAISIAPRHNKKVGVLFLDLDGFKQINDTLGHQVGDKLLQSVAERLRGCVRGSDTVSRQGGDEFVVLLSEMAHAEDAAITARRMLEAISEVHVVDENEVRVTTSIGIGVYPDDGTDAESLIKNADTAMYQAKESGRHGYQFYRPAMNLRAVERQQIEDALRHALDRDEFVLHFQPKVDLRTGEIAGAEALLRWLDPDRGIIAPTEFVPIAETCGLMQRIGQWVLREACRQVREWHDAGLKLASISVNVSTSEFQQSGFLEGVMDVLNDTGLDPRALELELTEVGLMKGADESDSVLQALRACGVQLAVDDFGTGYSNLGYLHRFPVHTLKIDKSFVREIGTVSGERSVVAAVLRMAQSLGLRVVAEGVETAEELAFLQYHQCDAAQGYYFSRPLPAPLFARLLRDGLLSTMAARHYERPFELHNTRRAANS